MLIWTAFLIIARMWLQFKHTVHPSNLKWYQGCRVYLVLSSVVFIGLVIATSILNCKVSKGHGNLNPNEDVSWRAAKSWHKANVQFLHLHSSLAHVHSWTSKMGCGGYSVTRPLSVKCVPFFPNIYFQVCQLYRILGKLGHCYRDTLCSPWFAFVLSWVAGVLNWYC